MNADAVKALDEALRVGFRGLQAIADSLVKTRATLNPGTAGEVEAALAAGATLRMHFATGKDGPIGLWLMLRDESTGEVTELLHVPAPDAGPCDGVKH